MKNKFSFLNERDLIPFYAEIMRDHDLNANAIKSFAWAIRKGNLQEIQEMFRILNENQKRGLINLFIDFSDLGGGYFDSAGFPTELAKKFGYIEIEDFLNDQKKELNRLTNAVTFFNKHKQRLKDGQYQDPLIEILRYLTSDELINMIETISTASEDYETTQEQVLRIITVLSQRNQSKLDIQNLERALCICSDNIIFTEFDIEKHARQIQAITLAISSIIKKSENYRFTLRAIFYLGQLNKLDDSSELFTIATQFKPRQIDAMFGAKSYIVSTFLSLLPCFNLDKINEIIDSRVVLSLPLLVVHELGDYKRVWIPRQLPLDRDFYFESLKAITTQSKLKKILPTIKKIQVDLDLETIAKILSQLPEKTKDLLWSFLINPIRNERAYFDQVLSYNFLSLLARQNSNRMNQLIDGITNETISIQNANDVFSAHPIPHDFYIAMLLNISQSLDESHIERLLNYYLSTNVLNKISMPKLLGLLTKLVENPKISEMQLDKISMFIQLFLFDESYVVMEYESDTYFLINLQTLIEIMGKKASKSQCARLISDMQPILNTNNLAQISWDLYFLATISEALSDEQLAAVYPLLKTEFDRLNYDTLSIFDYVVLQAFKLFLPQLKKHGILDDTTLYDAVIEKYPEDRQFDTGDMRLYDFFNELISVINNTVDYDELAAKYYQILTNESEPKCYLRMLALKSLVQLIVTEKIKYDQQISASENMITKIASKVLPLANGVLELSSNQHVAKTNLLNH